MPDYGYRTQKPTLVTIISTFTLLETILIQLEGMFGVNAASLSGKTQAPISLLPLLQNWKTTLDRGFTRKSRLLTPRQAGTGYRAFSNSNSTNRPFTAPYHYGAFLLLTNNFVVIFFAIRFSICEPVSNFDFLNTITKTESPDSEARTI